MPLRFRILIIPATLEVSLATTAEDLVLHPEFPDTGVKVEIFIPEESRPVLVINLIFLV